MTKYVYGAIVREDGEDGGYWAEVPDLPGCFGQGDTFMDAVESVSDAVETHLAALAADGAEIPAAGPVSADDGEVVYVYADPGTVQLDIEGPTVSAAEAARMLGVTPARVSQLVTDGRLVAQRTAGGTRVARAAVEALMAAPRAAGRPRKAATA